MKQNVIITEIIQDNLDLRPVDVNILQNSIAEVATGFDIFENFIQVFVYSTERELLDFNLNHTNFKLDSSEPSSNDDYTGLLLYPLEDVQEFGYNSGEVNIRYSFTKDVYGKKETKVLFIQDISSDRTEIRIDSLEITENDLIVGIQSLYEEIEKDIYLKRVYINLGNDTKASIVNVGTQQVGERSYGILKLYEPLDSFYEIGDTFSLEKKIANDVEFSISIDNIEEEPSYTVLSGPNFSTYSTGTESSNPTEFLTGQELLSNISEKDYKTLTQTLNTDLTVNVDYSNLENYIHFSSAEERLRNFKFKLEKINFLEQEKIKAENLQPIRLQESTKLFINQQLASIFKTFDHYDKFLYFESGSLSWPKVSNEFPYINQDVNTLESITFFNNRLQEGILFDEQNGNRLLNTIPEYIREDESNSPYNLFIDMIGEHFDNLWLYASTVSEKYNADNRLNFGISKDLLADTLRGFGVKLYDSDASFSELLTIFSGQIYNTGSEQVNTFISASNFPTSQDSYQKQIYKRLYHNLPYLIKAKGTERGVRGLINVFGVPEETLSIRYYGGANTQERPFFGPETSVTSSLSRIRLDNTGSITDGNTLSYYTDIIQDDSKYSQDLHTLEVGFSPTDNVNTLLKDLIPSSFDVDEYIGDPRLRYETRYRNLDKYTEDIIRQNIQTKYNLYDFFRLLKFFDNTLFKMIKDFVPARTNISTGIIIKSNLLERNKSKQVEPKWSKQDFSNKETKLDYTGSEYPSNFSIEENILIGEFDGRDGGAFKEGKITGTFDEFIFIGEYDTSFKYRVKLPRGGFAIKRSRDEAKYTGEFAGKVVSIQTFNIPGPPPPPPPKDENCYFDAGYIDDGYVECLPTVPGSVCYVEEGYVDVGYIECISPTTGTTCYFQEEYVDNDYVECITYTEDNSNSESGSDNEGIQDTSGTFGTYAIFNTIPSFIQAVNPELNPISTRKDINRVHNNFKKTNLKKYALEPVQKEVPTGPTPTPTPTPTGTIVTPTPTPTSFVTPTPTLLDCELQIGLEQPPVTPLPVTPTPTPTPTLNVTVTPTPTSTPADCNLEISILQD